MNNTTETGTLRDYLSVLKQRRLLVVAVTLTAVAAAVAYSAVKEPVYESTATVSFDDPTKQAGSLIGQAPADFTPADEAAAGAEIVTSSKVVQAVSKRPGVDTDPDQLRDAVSTEVDIDSNLIAIDVTDGDAEEAALIANAFAQETRRLTRNDAQDFFRQAARSIDDDPVNAPVKSRLQSLAAVAEPVQIFRDAEAPANPISPRPVRDGVIAGLLGLILGIGLAFLRHSLDRRITDAHQAQHDLALPIVGHIRNDALGSVGWAANGSSRISEEELEAFRILRTNVDFLAEGTDLRSVVVTSPLPEEGKSTVASWYAYANAVAGRRTALIECDFRRPVIADRFDLPHSPGLSDFLTRSNVGPKDVLGSVRVEGPQAVEVLAVIPAGESTQQPTELIGSQEFGDFLEQLSRAYDLVVIDSAPLLPVGDTLELLPQVDGILLCVRLHQTTREQGLAAKAAIEHLPAKPTGLVITGVERGADDDYYGYYSYAATSSGSLSKAPD